MAGPDPAIHVFVFGRTQNVDARASSGMTNVL